MRDDLDGIYVLEETNDENGGSIMKLLAGVAIGVAMMYFLDPNRGNRRRHLAGDKAVRLGRLARREVHDVAENARNHAFGKVAEVRGRMRDDVVTDDQLVARVRAELGHHVERARTIEVVADGGTVTLRGTVQAAELPELIAAVESVRGVASVNNELQAG